MGAMRSILFALFLPALAHAGEPPRPSPSPDGARKGEVAHPWTRFPVGSFARVKSGTPQMPVMSTTVLTAVRPDGYELRWESSYGNADKPRLEQRRLGEYAPSVDPQGKKVKDETLTIDGRKLACAVWEWTGVSNGQQMTTREWRAPGIAVPVKWTQEAIFYGQRLGVELAAVKLEETITVAGKAWKTVRMEGRTIVGGGSGIPLIRWATYDVPGGYVKEVRLKDGKEYSSTTVEAFGTGKP
jgi:hypothetical protein